MTATDTTIPNSLSKRVHRVEVRLRPDQNDPLAGTVLAQTSHLGIHTVRTARLFLIEAVLDHASLHRVAEELLSDPITQDATIGVAATPDNGTLVEVHLLPGVMDPVAQSTRDAIAEMLDDLSADQVEVRTGLRYDLIGSDVNPNQILHFAESVLANPVIHDIHQKPFVPEQFPKGTHEAFELVHIPIRDADTDALQKLSGDSDLFLSIDEMLAIQTYFQGIGREPTNAELETIAQTWSEHCVHKTLKSTITYHHNGPNPPGAQWGKRLGHRVNDDGSITIENLLKSTIAAATKQLMETTHADFCISVFEDNAGIVRFDNADGVCIKVETHNHPSAIEPYGGSATGIGGCIRDVMGTGLSARPIANTDVFCVASATPSTDLPELPKGVIEPGRILRQVVAGVRDYGNRMGIPTVNGAVWFHKDYLANPLVFCGCVGLIPLDKCFGRVEAGDHIVALGGRTGRDGIHGATFSSAELTDTHADTFAHAVQIGNAITQKKMMDVILQARDYPTACLFHAITDCGAGGFSSAVGEMGRHVGAHVNLEAAPLKYEGLTYTEIWISEAQERMVLAVPPGHLEPLRRLCENEDVEYCDLGQFGATNDDDQPELLLTYQNHQVARISMDFLHEGIPTPLRQARWTAAHGEDELPPVSPRQSATVERTHPKPNASRSTDVSKALKILLGHPNIASKHWIVRQYDHEVQGGSVIKPLMGPHQDGPSDAAVLRPKLTSDLGIALGCGLQPGLSEKATGRTAVQGDSYWAALAAIDEAVRNVVCVGADPQRIAILDNFCWPNCDEPEQLGSLVRAAEACHDGALAYHTPFVSGKDSLSNQFTTEQGLLITIPPTLLITALGIVPCVQHCCSMFAKAPGNHLMLVGVTELAMGGSHYATLGNGSPETVMAEQYLNLSIPHLDLAMGPRTAAAVALLIKDGLVRSAHDCSDGGILVAAAEMAFAGRIGLELNLTELPVNGIVDEITQCFAETPSRYLLEVEASLISTIARHLQDQKVPYGIIGTFASHHRLKLSACEVDESLEDLRNIWQAPLDW